jgi:type VI protein secretion system component Hcp
VRNPVLAIAIAFMLATPCTAFAGEKKQKDAIEINSYSWGASNAGSMSKSTGGGTGKVRYHDFSITRKVDKASPILMSKPVGGSTGPTKPTLPTTATQHR